MQRFSYRLIPAVGLVLAGPIRAQQADIPILVTATATRTGDGPASAALTVASEDISRSQPASLRDALDGLAGVRAVSTGGAGGGSYVSIRGGEPNFTMVLLDGIRLNDGTNSKGGAFDFGLLDPALVERVEVDRGAGSAVHGSDALSGVINIRLREPASSGTHLLARLAGGTLGDHGGALGITHGWTGGGVLLAGSAYNSDERDAGSTLTRQQLLGRFSQRIGAFDLVALGLYAHDRHAVFPEDSGGPELAALRDQETGSGELWTTAISLRRNDGAAIRPALSLSYAEQSSDAATPPIAPGVLDGVPAITARNSLMRFEAIGHLTAQLPALVATVGAAFLDERGRSAGAIDFGFPVPADFQIDRRTLSGFAEATLTPLGGLTANGALRLDAVEGGPQQWTGRASIAYRIGQHGPALVARWGRGFKLPSFYALANPLVGNPALRAERSRNMEAGVEWTARNGGRIRVAWFDNRFTDLVDFDPVAFQVVNRARVDTRGLEAEAAWPTAHGVTLTGAITYLELQSPVPLRNRPRWQGRAGLAWQAAPRLELGGTFHFNSSFNDSSVPTGLIVTSGHAEIDASLRYTLSRAVRLDVALSNLGNARTGQAVGFPGTARRLQFALSGAF